MLIIFGKGDVDKGNTVLNGSVVHALSHCLDEWAAESGYNFKSRKHLITWYTKTQLRCIITCVVIRFFHT